MSALAERIRAVKAEHPELGCVKIARIVGCTPPTVIKALNPERTREYHRRSEAKPGRNERKREWDRANRPPCADCGEPTWRGTRCESCHRRYEAAEHRARVEQAARLYNDGVPMREISAAFGYQHRSGADGYVDEARKLGLIGYRYQGWANKAA